MSSLTPPITRCSAPLMGADSGSRARPSARPRAGAVDRDLAVRLARFILASRVEPQRTAGTPRPRTRASNSGLKPGRTSWTPLSKPLAVRADPGALDLEDADAPAGGSTISALAGVAASESATATRPLLQTTRHAIASRRTHLRRGTRPRARACG